MGRRGLSCARADRHGCRELPARCRRSDKGGHRTSVRLRAWRTAIYVSEVHQAPPAANTRSDADAGKQSGSKGTGTTALIGSGSHQTCSGLCSPSAPFPLSTSSAGIAAPLWRTTGGSARRIGLDAQHLRPEPLDLGKAAHEDGMSDQFDDGVLALGQELPRGGGGVRSAAAAVSTVAAFIGGSFVVSVGARRGWTMSPRSWRRPMLDTIELGSGFLLADAIEVRLVVDVPILIRHGLPTEVPSLVEPVRGPHPSLSGLDVLAWGPLAPLLEEERHAGRARIGRAASGTSRDARGGPSGRSRLP